VNLPANFASMSVEELWEIYEEISKLLEAKMLAEKKILERRLISLHTAETDRLQARRPYPPVVPMFANPDEPSQVWSGRGKRPQWVTEKLASGLALEDLSIGRGSSVAAMSEEDDS
jgi:DNA-binding protein H-NS